MNEVQQPVQTKKDCSDTLRYKSHDLQPHETNQTCKIEDSLKRENINTLLCQYQLSAIHGSAALQYRSSDVPPFNCNTGDYCRNAEMDLFKLH